MGLPRAHVLSHVHETVAWPRLVAVAARLVTAIGAVLAVTLFDVVEGLLEPLMSLVAFTEKVYVLPIRILFWELKVTEVPEVTGCTGGVVPDDDFALTVYWRWDAPLLSPYST